MFLAYDHTNYVQKVPVYLITLLNLSDTHSRCKELDLQNNGFSLSQSSVLKSIRFRNPIKNNKLNLFDLRGQEEIDMVHQLKQPDES